MKLWTLFLICGIMCCGYNAFAFPVASLGRKLAVIIAKRSDDIVRVVKNSADDVVRTVKNSADDVVRAVSKAKTAKVLGLCEGALPDKEIARLAKIVKDDPHHGLKKVGEQLGKANYMKYGEYAGHAILQDTFLRIAVQNKVLPPPKAMDVWKHLKSTDGLTSLLKKINSTNLAQAKGHLRELDIGLTGAKRGGKVRSFGKKFADGVKGGDTDLDVLLEVGGKKFAIESKAYTGVVKADMIKADADSLIKFCKDNPETNPIFCFEKAESISPVAKKILEEKGIKYISGTAEDVISQIDMLIKTK